MRYGRFPVPSALPVDFDYKLEELWCVKHDLMEESYKHFVESGGIDPSQGVLQIFADPDE